VRHLSRQQSLAALGRGDAIEQLVSTGQTIVDTVEWLCLSPESSGFKLTRHRVQNIGDPDFLDVYELPPIDVDEELGEGLVVAICDDGALALDMAAQFGAVPDKWVNQGLVQDEYADRSG
jgi:hypothetical protein